MWGSQAGARAPERPWRDPAALGMGLLPAGASRCPGAGGKVRSPQRRRGQATSPACGRGPGPSPRSAHLPGPRMHAGLVSDFRENKAPALTVSHPSSTWGPNVTFLGARVKKCFVFKRVRFMAILAMQCCGFVRAPHGRSAEQLRRPGNPAGRPCPPPAHALATGDPLSITQLCLLRSVV